MELDFRFGTVGSPLSTPKKPGGSAGGVQRAAELGLNALELAWVQSVRANDTTCESIRAAAAQAGVALSVHAPYFINLNANGEEWPKGRKRLMDAARCGTKAGATDIVFHPGSYFGQPAGEVLRVAVARLRECVRELRDEGNPVLLRAETMGKSALLGSLPDVLAMATAVDGVEPCIDFSHLHARPGDGSGNSYAEWVAMLELIKSEMGAPALKRLHIHLSGIEYGPKGEKCHLVLKESDLKYRELLRALRDHGCQGRILCESPNLEDDAQLLQRTWRKAAASR